MGWIKAINSLSRPEKEGLYRILIPPSLFARFQINPLTFTNADGRLCCRFYCAPGDTSTLIEVRRTPEDPDCIFSYQIADTRTRPSSTGTSSSSATRRRRGSTPTSTPRAGTPCSAARRATSTPSGRRWRRGLFPGQVRAGLSVSHEFFPRWCTF